MNIIISKVKVAAKEDKLEIEHAFVLYESVVRSHEEQVKAPRASYKIAKEELDARDSSKLDKEELAVSDSWRKKEAKEALQTKIKDVKQCYLSVGDQVRRSNLNVVNYDEVGEVKGTFLINDLIPRVVLEIRCGTSINSSHVTIIPYIEA